MSAQANIVAFDGASTPVSHTFVPVSSSSENGELIALWRENLASVPVYANATVQMKMRKMKNDVYRVSVRVDVPNMEAITNQNAAGYTAAPKVAYVDSCDAVFYFSARSTSAGRKLARQVLINILGNVSTSVTPSSAGPAKELIDDLIIAS